MLETANDENPDDSNAWCRWSSSLTAKQHNSTPVLGRSAPFSLCQLFHLAHNFLFHSAHFFIQATFSLSLQLLFFSLDPQLPFSLDPLFHWGHFFARPTTSFILWPTFSLGPLFHSAYNFFFHSVFNFLFHSAHNLLFHSTHFFTWPTTPGPMSNAIESTALPGKYFV